jgi:hypothetical protein
LRRYPLGAALLLLAGTACGSGAPSGPGLVAVGAPYRVTVTLPDPGAVFLYGVRTFHANRAVTVRTFVPRSVPAGVTLLTVRAFLGSRSGVAYCTKSWPLPGYGPTSAVKFLKVAKGATISFTVYGKVTRPGAYVLDGYAMSYDDGKGLPKTIEEASGQRLDVVAAAPGAKGVRPCPAAEADAFTRPAP